MWEGRRTPQFTPPEGQEEGLGAREETSGIPDPLGAGARPGMGEGPRDTNVRHPPHLRTSQTSSLLEQPWGAEALCSFSATEATHCPLPPPGEHLACQMPSIRTASTLPSAAPCPAISTATCSRRLTVSAWESHRRLRSHLHRQEVSFCRGKPGQSCAFPDRARLSLDCRGTH